MTFFLYILNISLLLLLTMKMPWFKRTGISPSLLVFLLIIKMAVSVIGGVLYMKMYNGGDTAVFFKDGLTINEILTESPDLVPDLMRVKYIAEMRPDLISRFHGWIIEDRLYNDNRTVSLIHAFIAYISGGIYNIHAIWFAFLSLAGMSGWLKLLNCRNEKLPLLLVIPYFLVPDSLFFLSVAGKESASIFITGIVAGNLSSIIRSGPGLLNISITFIFLVAGLFIKPYFTLLAIPAFTAWFISEKHKTASPWSVYLAVYTGFMILTYSASTLIPSLDILSLLYNKRQAFEGLARAYPDGFDTWTWTPTFSNSWVSLLKAIPAATGVGIIQPLMLRTDNIFITLLSFENIVYISLIGIMIYRIIQSPSVGRRNNILFCITLMLSMYALIGLTTPVAGAIVRYKSMVLPLLMFAVITIIAGNKEKKPFC